MHRTRRAAVLFLLLAAAGPMCGAPSQVAGPLVRETVAAVDPPTTAPTTTEAPTTVPPTTAPPTTAAPTTAPPPPTTAAPVRAKAVAPTTLPRPPAPPREVVGDILPYKGLGTWVDVYDWSHYHNSTPTVGPDDVDHMADVGVQTLFIQTAKNDTPDAISEPDLLMPIIDRAHQRGIHVVAWYLPTLEDPNNDLQRILASAQLDVDGIAIDIESRKVADPAERSRRLIDLSNTVRAQLPGRAIGAIVLPPVATEVINPNYWPGFPWQEIAPDYDVWMPMGYWTVRTQQSGYHDGYKYTDENIRRLRADLNQPDAPVHAVGGIADAATDAEIDAYRKASVDDHTIGGSLYDWHTTRADTWPHMTPFRV